MTSFKKVEIHESKTLKNYKRNKLNKANFGEFTYNDYLVFSYLISKLGGVDANGKYLQSEELPREHIVTAREFSETFEVDIDNSYRFISKAVDKLLKTDIRIKEPDGYTRINICSKAKYQEKKGRIFIKFTDDIMPYLAQAKEKFVMYNLKEISNFGSLYTIRLYELIQEFKETGWMVKSIEQLRESLSVGNKYKLYGDLKKYTFEHAVNEINANYKIGINFEEIKEGRKVSAVKFTFKKTFVNKTYQQHTGKVKNRYNKPERIKNVLKLKPKQPNNNDVLEGQMKFEDVRDKTHVSNVLSNMLKT